MPRKLDAATIDAILDDIAVGVATIRACKAQRADPRDFYRHMLRDEDIGQRYTRAKVSALEVLADEILQIADQAKIGKVVTDKGDGTKEVKKADAVERARLRIDSRKWLLAKLAPKKYGDRTVIAGDPDAPIIDPKAELLRGLVAVAGSGGDRSSGGGAQ